MTVQRPYYGMMSVEKTLTAPYSPQIAKNGGICGGYGLGYLPVQNGGQNENLTHSRVSRSGEDSGFRFVLKGMSDHPISRRGR